MRNGCSVSEPSDFERVVADGLDLAFEMDWFAFFDLEKRFQYSSTNNLNYLSHVVLKRNDEDWGHFRTNIWDLDPSVLVEVLQVFDFAERLLMLGVGHDLGRRIDGNLTLANSLSKVIRGLH